MNLKDVEFQYTKGKGPGGQHKNKTESCVIATHVPTGIRVRVDGRCQHRNRRDALRLLDERTRESRESADAARRKNLRDRAIHDRTRVRTYDFSTGQVIDHRTGKRASIKDILVKGKLEKLR